MSVTTIQPADPATMGRLRDKWQAELRTAEYDLRQALKDAARISSEAVRIAHLIDNLRETVDQRTANLAKYR